MGKKHKNGSNDLTISIAVTSYGDDDKILKIPECGDEKEMQKFLEDVGSNEQLDGFGSLSLGELLESSDDLEIEAGFRIIKSLTHHPTTREVLEALLLKALRIGQKMS